MNAGNSSLDTIILGNGNDDEVNAEENAADTMSLGNGAGDVVNARRASNDNHPWQRRR